MIPLYILGLLSYLTPPVRGDGGHDDDSDSDDDDDDKLPTLQFNKPDNSTSCDSMIFSWTATGGQATTMTLLVTNHNVPNHTASSTSVNETLTSAVSTGAQLFLWSKVDVTEGWYIAEAQLSSSPHTLLSQSSPFFVQTGTDLSCISNTSSQSATSLSSASSTGSAAPLSTAVLSPTAASTSSSLSPTFSAQSDTTISHLNTPEIIGTVVGSVAAFVILALAFLCPQWWRRALPSSRHRYNAMYY